MELGTRAVTGMLLELVLEGLTGIRQCSHGGRDGSGDGSDNGALLMCMMVRREIQVELVEVVISG